ncbi:MAG TPA: hypothetical protein VFH97_00025 [Gemmatimonadales bacterium]|nr:hypothetical protein [Gemmatimonadales bacterium]
MRTIRKGEAAAPGVRSQRLPECSFNEIETPGSYLLMETGSLVRVPAEALAPGHPPLVSITSQEPARVAKLSDNPATPISVLRTIAAHNDLYANF